MSDLRFYYGLYVPNLECKIYVPNVECKMQVIYCKWSADGDTLFSGYTDEVIRVWGFLSLLEKKRRHDDHSNFFYRFKWLLFCTSVLRLIFF